MEPNPIAAAAREYVANAGAHQPEKEWILTPYDSWERNPHYQGEPGVHPEDLAYPIQSKQNNIINPASITYAEYQDLTSDDNDDVPF